MACNHGGTSSQVPGAVDVHGEKPLEAAERAELQRLRRHVSELEKDNAFLVKASAYFCRDAEEPARFALMAECAVLDDITGVAGTAVPEGDRFPVRRMARLLKVSASGYYAYVKRCAATALSHVGSAARIWR